MKNLPKVGIACCLDTQEVRNFDEIALSVTVKEIAYGLHFEQFPIESQWANPDFNDMLYPDYEGNEAENRNSLSHHCLLE